MKKYIPLLKELTILFPFTLGCYGLFALFYLFGQLSFKDISFYLFTGYLGILALICFILVQNNYSTWKEIFYFSFKSRKLFLYTLVMFIPVLYMRLNNVSHSILFSCLVWFSGIVAILYGSRVVMLLVCLILILAYLFFLMGQKSLAEAASQLFFYLCLVLIVSWF
jgi:hypothetical protein